MIRRSSAMQGSMRFREEQPLSVSGLNRAVRLGLENEWGDVLVVGEVSDLTRSHAGHLYFTLNDEREQAQLRIVMFGGDARRTRAAMEDGARVRLRGRLTLYEPRGTFQMIARSAMPAGEGDLLAQFRRILAKLEAEGLTSPERKRKLPLFPRCIGVVTSEHGAALHDILRVSARRSPVRIVIAPTLVQGADAPAAIVRALNAVQKLPELEVVIVARGGGSAEDLWAFNDERVVRAIAACRVPVVSGVGHEVDVTLADLVADVRAATPSNAAELVVPEREVLEGKLDALTRHLSRALESKVDRGRLALERFGTKLRDPRAALASARGKLDKLDAAQVRALEARLFGLRHRLGEQHKRLQQHDPRRRLSAQHAALSKLRAELGLSPSRFVAARRHWLEQRMGQLHALSPLAVLGRGYAIAFDDDTGRVVRRAEELPSGARLRVRVAEGEIRARVE